MAAAGGVGLSGAGGPGFHVVVAARDAIAAHGMLAGGEKVVVAVSGGPDSNCLLDVLGRLAAPLDLTLVVAHFDHGLSGDSGAVAEEVAAMASDAGHEFHLERARDLAGPNLHARAREARYGFLEGLARRLGAVRVATGHTLDDRVETLLARLVHGGSTAALASIPPVQGLRIRPLIGVRRAETVAYCAARGLRYHADPANDDLRFDRARVRTRLLTAIEGGWGEGAVRAIAAAAERFHEDEDVLSALAEDAYAAMARSGAGGTEIDLEGLRVLPRAMQRRVLERAVGRVRDRSKGIDAVLDALAGDPKPGSRFALPGGTWIRIDSGAVAVSRQEGTTER